jgi:regulator of extracellular matrix RemA (YlzA/DUF370 family)
MITDSGYVILSSLTPEVLSARFEERKDSAQEMEEDV